MGKGKKGSSGRSGGSGGGGGTGSGGFSTIDVDPRRVRYAHSKIRPVFSGCGRTIEQTLGEIREGKIRASDLPAITVLFGPTDPTDGQPWFFSLNNRRLYVLKACREEGLLGRDGLVRVRGRAMKVHEQERYTLDRCSLQAKFLFEPKTKPKLTLETKPNTKPSAETEIDGEAKAEAGSEPEVDAEEVKQSGVAEAHRWRQEQRSDEEEEEDEGEGNTPARGEGGGGGARGGDDSDRDDGSSSSGGGGGGGGDGGGGGSGQRVVTTSSDRARGGRRKERGGAGVVQPEESVAERWGGGVEGKGKQERPRKGRRRKAGAERLEA